MGSLKNFFYPSRCEAYPRIGHRCIQIGHHILVFGGCNAQMDFNLPLLRINCETIHTDVIPTKNALRLQGFSLFSYKTHIYLWAGSTPTEVRPTPRSPPTLSSPTRAMSSRPSRSMGRCLRPGTSTLRRSFRSGTCWCMGEWG